MTKAEVPSPMGQGGGGGEWGREATVFQKTAASVSASPKSGQGRPRLERGTVPSPPRLPLKYELPRGSVEQLGPT